MVVAQLILEGPYPAIGPSSLQFYIKLGQGYADSLLVVAYVM